MLTGAPPHISGIVSKYGEKVHSDLLNSRNPNRAEGNAEAFYSKKQHEPGT